MTWWRRVLRQRALERELDAVALVASIIPARRATRLEPTTALRIE